MGLFVYTEVLK